MVNKFLFVCSNIFKGVTVFDVVSDFTFYLSDFTCVFIHSIRPRDLFMRSYLVIVVFKAVFEWKISFDKLAKRLTSFPDVQFSTIHSPRGNPCSARSVFLDTSESLMTTRHARIRQESRGYIFVKLTNTKAFQVGRCFSWRQEVIAEGYWCKKLLRPEITFISRRIITSYADFAVPSESHVDHKSYAVFCCGSWEPWP